jgi:uncharacterized membrane protein YgcG
LPDPRTFTVTNVTNPDNPLPYLEAERAADINGRTRGMWTYTLYSDYNELRWFVNISRGQPVYEIKYTYKNILDAFPDAAQLDVMLFTGGAIGYIRHYDAELVFPDGFTGLDSFRCYAHNQPDAELSAAENSLKLRVENPKAQVNGSYGILELRAAAGSEALALFDLGAEYANIRTDYTYESILREEEEWAAGKDKYAGRKLIAMAADVGLALLAAAGFVVLVLYVKRGPAAPFKPKTDYKYYREIPAFGPTIAGCLLDFKKGGKVKLLEAAVLHLCRSGYMKVIQFGPRAAWKKENTGFLAGERLVDSGAYRPEKPDESKPSRGTRRANQSASAGGASAVPDGFVAPPRNGASTRFGVGVGVSFQNPKTAAAFSSPAIARLPLSPYEKEVLKLFIGSGLNAERPIPLRAVFPTGYSALSASSAPIRAFAAGQKDTLKTERAKSGFFTPARGFVKRAGFFVTLFGMIAAVAAGLLSLAFTVTPYGFALFFPLALLWGTVVAGIGYLGGVEYTLTQAGADAASETVGLYNFFRDLTLMKEAELPHLDKWEEYLVYATAFGVADKVAKVLAAKYPAEFGLLSVSVYFSHFGGSMHALSGISHAVHTGSVLSGAGSSGGSGSFGSSGGGGGGHGGGGGGGRH